MLEVRKMSASSSGKGAGYGNNGNNSRVRSKSSLGWTAFDQKQKHGRRNSEPGVVFEDYPVLSGLSPGQILPNKKNEVLEKPFSAVVVAPMKFPSLKDTREYVNKESQRSIPINNVAGKIGTPVGAEAYQKLNRLHPWADQTLIQDVLAGVNYNVQEASALLEAMVISDEEAHNKDVGTSRGSGTGPVSTSNDYVKGSYVESDEACQELHRLYPWADRTLIQDVLASVNYDMQVALSLLETLLISDRETRNGSGCWTNIVPVSALYDSVKAGFVESTKETHTGLLKNSTTKPPVEPEWYEDDVYLIHRKDAIKMMRSASRHSKAANDAFFRGDHASAHLLSLKAREDWAAAEKLNTKAAMEILTLRNDKNDAWTLDLHGLHASEAVKALKERLQMVESPFVSSYDFALPNGDHEESSMFVSSTSLDHVNMTKLGGEHLSSRRKPMLLQVITGKGNHSRGAAALPSAIRSFLSENRYRFDDSRPGVVMVRPKFRQQRQG